MAMTTAGTGGVSSEINVTPMIDVLLVLLIIFMVVIAMGRTAVKIHVPPVETGRRDAGPSAQIVLELHDDGTYWVNSTQVGTTELATFLTSLYRERPDKLIFLKPGQNRSYADVIRMTDLCHGAGIDVIGVTPIEIN